ncbi:MAG TPA: hypothetical protein VJ995_00150 [Geothermobacteraceae bacterium]|nr:hypothetical protein [Geothermobacteraceae bacterium]
MKKLNRNLLFVCLLILLLTPSLVLAEAVSQVNGKAEGVVASLDGDSAFVALGSASVPIHPQLGAQVDTAFGKLDSENLFGFGLHLFTRDPQFYLLGAIVSYTENDDFDMYRYGVEGEYYYGPYTVSAILGLQNGDVDSNGFGAVDFNWYPNDEFMVQAGVSFADSDDTKGHIGGEFLVRPNVAAFADLAIGVEDYEHALAGIRYYFGDAKPLLQKHREDDPSNNLLTGTIQALNSFRALE